MPNVSLDFRIALSAQTQTPSYTNHVLHVEKAEPWTKKYGTDETKSATDQVY